MLLKSKNYQKTFLIIHEREYSLYISMDEILKKIKYERKFRKISQRKEMNIDENF
jgi:hypothetical protein